MHQHRGRRLVLAFAVASALLIPVVPAGAQTPADNTKVNTRDRAKGAATADQQKENTTDREITQKIRRALMDDKTLSTYAHNVKIIAQDGQVTLKGPVRQRTRRRPSRPRPPKWRARDTSPIKSASPRRRVRKSNSRRTST